MPKLWTPGGSGTPAGYVLHLQHLGGGTPADASTYYFSATTINGLQTLTTIASASPRVGVPKTGTLKGWSITVSIGGTLGTTETSTFALRINDTTDVTLSTGVKHDATFQKYSGSALSQALTLGDDLVIKVTTATWATNPTGMFYAVDLYVEIP